MIMNKTDSHKQPQRQVSAREVALDVITRVENGAYSHLLLNQSLQKAKLERPDAALATELVYGSIQRLNTLDYYLDKLVAKGVKSLEPWVRNLLRMSLYQILYLTRIPPHAAVNEAVKLTKRRGHAGITGMVNGVLRNALRQQEQLIIPANMPPVRRLALLYSHPEWMVERWINQYGTEVAERICQANLDVPHTSVRTNLRKLSRHELMDTMRQQGLQTEPSPLSPAGIMIEYKGNIAASSWFEEGKCTIQDESSMLVAEAVEPLPGMVVLDCCAAPGGKTTHLAEKMGDNGSLIACDVHEHKEKLIKEQANRLGLNCIRTTVLDARNLPDHFPQNTFDRILLDAPCSGLGVIRRKPDIKWAKDEAEILSIQDIQYELLSAVHGLLKPGGILVYSTCTMTLEENEGMVARFLSEHPHFRLEPFPPSITSIPELGPYMKQGLLQIFPFVFGTDGFFIARMKKLF